MTPLEGELRTPGENSPPEIRILSLFIHLCIFFFVTAG